MKQFFLALTLCLGLLAACGTPAVNPPSDTPPPDETPLLAPDPDAPLSLASDETPAYVTCRIVDGAEDGSLLLAELDSALYGGHDGLHDGKSVYRLPLTEDVAVTLDGEPASAATLADGMPVEIAFNGTILETFPAQLGQVYSVAGYSIGSRQCPGGSLYDLCGLYLQALDDLWEKDFALNDGIASAALDLSRAPGDLLDSEKSALVWRFGELHGVEVLEAGFDELLEQGYLHIEPDDPALDNIPGACWLDGCLFTIRASSGHEGEAYSLPVVFFDVEKWRGPLAACILWDCFALWPECGTWSGYTAGAEMIS